jgi:hypothetical protein
MSTILEPFKSTKLPYTSKRTLINPSRRRIHIADQQKGTAPESRSRRHGEGPFHVEPQSGSQSAFGSRDYPTHREDEPKHTLEETYANKPEQAPLQVEPTITRSTLKGEEEWEEFAQLIKLPDGTPKWQCHWRTMDDGVEVNCGYLSKKQLVKRHVETTHLKYRRVSIYKAQ